LRRATKDAATKTRVESLFGGQTGGKSIAKIATAIERGEEAPVFIDRVVNSVSPSRWKPSRNGPA